MKFKTIDTIIKFSIIFLIGFLLSNIINLYFIYGSELPLGNVLGFSSLEKAPTDYIRQDQVEVFDDKIIINIKRASISSYAATGSMIPVLNEDSNGIRIVPESEEEINIGDIITFQQDSYLIIHRVIDKGVDDDGTYFITKGDNNEISDGKIRFKNIRYKTIGMLW